MNHHGSVLHNLSPSLRKTNFLSGNKGIIRPFQYAVKYMSDMSTATTYSNAVRRREGQGSIVGFLKCSKTGRLNSMTYILTVHRTTVVYPTRNHEQLFPMSPCRVGHMLCSEELRAWQQDMLCVFSGLAGSCMSGVGAHCAAGIPTERVVRCSDLVVHGMWTGGGAEMGKHGVGVAFRFRI
jgi:hypothetical protein